MSHRLSAAFPPADGTPLEKHITDAVCHLGFDLPVGLGMMRRLTCKSYGPRICWPCRKLTCGRLQLLCDMCAGDEGSCLCMFVLVGEGCLAVCLHVSCVCVGGAGLCTRTCTRTLAGAAAQGQGTRQVGGTASFCSFLSPPAAQALFCFCLLSLRVPPPRYCDQMIPGAGLAFREGLVFQV